MFHTIHTEKNQKRAVMYFFPKIGFDSNEMVHQMVHKPRSCMKKLMNNEKTMNFCVNKDFGVNSKDKWLYLYIQKWVSSF